jgi:hypothetical protein
MSDSGRIVGHISGGPDTKGMQAYNAAVIYNQRVMQELARIHARMVKEVMPDSRVGALEEAAMSLSLAADTLKNGG